MEIDDVETGQLLQRFGSMQTEDRSESIKQMRKLVGGEHALSESKATFYLEMSNWNVHAAVGYYFDLEASQDQQGPQLKMTFVRDVTIGEGESVPPSTCFVKTWTIRNPGPEPWPASTTLKMARGHQMGVQCTQISVPSLNAGECVDISVQMQSPDQPGTYDSEWRLSSPSGVYFGDSIWCILTVDHAGTMALTQQLNAFNVNSAAVGGASSEQAQNNPFHGISNVVSFAGGQRPVSPTDAQVSDVSPRNVLSRMVGNNQQDLINAPTPIHMEEDEEMN